LPSRKSSPENYDFGVGRIERDYAARRLDYRASRKMAGADPQLRSGGYADGGGMIVNPIESDSASRDLNEI
jgi:hypothetical protein